MDYQRHLNNCYRVLFSIISLDKFLQGINVGHSKYMNFSEIHRPRPPVGYMAGFATPALMVLVFNGGEREFRRKLLIGSIVLGSCWGYEIIEKILDVGYNPWDFLLSISGVLFALGYQYLLELKKD